MLAPEPYFEPRGTPFSIYYRCKALTELGYQVDLLTYPIGEDRTMPGLRIIRTPRIPGINNIDIGLSIKKLILDSVMLVRLIPLLLTYRYLCVHTHEEFCFVGAVLQRLLCIPHIYDMHSSLPQHLSENYQVTSSRLIVSFAKWLERLAVRSSRGVITICHDLKDLAESIVKTSRKPAVVEMIENVATMDAAVCPDAEPKRRFFASLGLPDNKAIITYTGNLEANQGIELLIDAINILKNKRDDFRCLIVGGKPRQVDKFKAYAKEGSIQDLVRFTGQKPIEEIPMFLACSDILVSPRCAGTNVPLKIYTYMQSGKAILATDIYSHTQVLNDQNALLVKPTAHDLARGMEMLLDDLKLREKLARQAMHDAQEKYSYTAYKARLATFYESILG